MVWSKFHPYRCSGISKSVLNGNGESCFHKTHNQPKPKWVKELDRSHPYGKDDNEECVLNPSSYLSKDHIFRWPAKYMWNMSDNNGNIQVLREIWQADRT